MRIKNKLYNSENNKNINWYKIYLTINNYTFNNIY